MVEDVRNLINIGSLTTFPLYKFIYARYRLYPGDDLWDFVVSKLEKMAWSIYLMQPLSGMPQNSVLNRIEKIELEQMHFVMDKGYYTDKGIAPLLEKYIKFAISVPFSTKAAKELAEDCMDGICSSANAVMAGENIYYAQTYRRKWNNRRVYYHVYYDEERHVREKEEGRKSARRISTQHGRRILAQRMAEGDF